MQFVKVSVALEMCRHSLVKFKPQ